MARRPAVSRISRKLIRYIQLSRAEKRLFAEASVAVLFARIAVSTMPYRTVHAATQRLRRGVQRYDALQARERADKHLVAEAVERAGRQIPGARCLPRALAGSVLLARHGHACAFRIGVRRPSQTGIEAHAWLEQDGEVLVGGPVPPDFVAFPPFES